jgi:hypothetical protein
MMEQDERIYGARQSRERTPNGKRLAAYKDATLVRKASRQKWYASKRRCQQRKIEEQDIGSQSDNNRESPIIFGQREESSSHVVPETPPTITIGGDVWDHVDYPSPLPQPPPGLWRRLLWFW